MVPGFVLAQAAPPSLDCPDIARAVKICCTRTHACATGRSWPVTAPRMRPLVASAGGAGWTWSFSATRSPMGGDAVAVSPTWSSWQALHQPRHWRLDDRADADPVGPTCSSLKPKVIVLLAGTNDIAGKRVQRPTRTSRRTSPAISELAPAQRREDGAGERAANQRLITQSPNKKSRRRSRRPMTRIPL